MNFNSARSSIKWNTGEYDTRSAPGLSEGNGLLLFILTELKSVETRFSEIVNTQNFTRAA